MKEKNKKILKGLGVGALACFGMLTFTGCSVDLSQQQIDKLMYTVENSDKFMDEVVDLLNKQNNQMDKQKIFDLYRLAETKLMLNYDNVLDNLKVTSKVVSDDDFQSVKFYKTESGQRVAIMNDMDSSEIVYSNENKTAVCNGIGQDYVKTIEDVDFNTYISQNGYISSCLALTNMYEKDINDIVDFKTNDLGDYEITMLNVVKEEGENSYEVYTMITKVVINAEGYLTEVELTIACTDSSMQENINSSRTMASSFEYGALTLEDIDDELQIAKDTELTNQ